MRTNELGRRYALALFEEAKQSQKIDAVAEELSSFALAFQSNDEVRGFFTSPVVSSELKTEMLKEPLQKLGIGSEVTRLILLAVRKGRLDQIESIKNAYIELVDKENGVIRGAVRSAAPLSDQHKNQLKDLVGKFVSGDVVLNYEEDPALIGGTIAEVGGWIFDDSIDSHLTRLNEDLKRSVH